MKLIRYEYPHAPGSSAINRLFDMGVPSLERFGGLFDDLFSPDSGSHQPAADLYEDDSNFYARFELPGVKKDAIDVELENSVLTISSNQTEEIEDVTRAYCFQRSVSVPDGVALEKVSASYQDGILTVTMPMNGARKPHHISVK